MMIDTNFVNQVNTLSEQTIQLCYHCHKCTAGCPVAFEMHYGPDRVLRMIQLGQREPLLGSPDIWICASCETCGTRCPNEIDIARVMDALRQIAIAERATIAEPDAVKFHRLFLALVQRLGRMHEATLMGIYLPWTFGILDYVDSGIKLFVKGKVPLIPHPIQGRDEIQRIFEATGQKGNGAGPRRHGAQKTAGEAQAVIQRMTQDPRVWLLGLTLLVLLPLILLWKRRQA